MIYSNPQSLLKFDNYYNFFSLRPYAANTSKGFSLKINSLYSYSSSPNLDNVGNLFSLNGHNYFTSFKIEYFGKNIVLLIEPYSLKKENKDNRIFSRGGRYTYTNEVSNVNSSPYIDEGIRESLFFLHHNFIGIGISNLNQWIGPGIHNSLTMSSNSKGFKHLFIGTLNEKYIRKNISFEARYTFAKLNDRAGGVYLTNLVATLSLYSDIKYKFGIVRDFLSGGKRSSTGKRITEKDAMGLVFGPLFSDSKKSLDYTTDWGFEPWDQVITGFIEIYPDKNTTFYLEAGTGDHRKNFTDLLAHWDHNLAYTIGFRRFYEYSNSQKKNYFVGIEYTNLNGNSNTRKFRASGPWFDNWWYDYNSFEGRRWAAHSGSDSDDIRSFFGLKVRDFYLITSFGKERKGLYLEEKPELKDEISLTIEKEISRGLSLISYFEKEEITNYCFKENETKSDFCVSISLEYFFR